MFGGAPLRPNKYMSGTKFEVIVGSLCHIFQKDVGCYDGFLHMRKMEESWNLKMAEEFNPSWPKQEELVVN